MFKIVFESVSYTHLDVYKRQVLGVDAMVEFVILEKGRTV